ncbi:sensor histidine kinase [Longispora urticae]
MTWGVRRLVAAALTPFRALREDLWTTALDPLPRRAGTRFLARLPHVLVVLFGVGALIGEALEIASHRAGREMDTGMALAGGMAIALMVAMFRPVLAWWAVTLLMVVGARYMEASAGVVSFPIPFPGGSANPPFPWTYAGLVTHAGVMFLLALRVRLRAAITALVISVLAGQACVTFGLGGHKTDVGLAAVVLGTAVLVGTALRGRRVARAELVAQAELTAGERARRTLLEERGRIARELHDVVAHHMSVISIQAQVAPHLVENPSDELRANLAGIRENAVAALNELRRVLGVLRSEDTPAEDAPQPDLARLDELLDNVRTAGLTVTAATTGEPRPLPPGVELSAYRIVQEALSNVLRHAPGATAHVLVYHDPSGLIVRVTNTPPARPGPPPDGESHGLLGMRERTAMLGGELATGPTPDGGYQVTANLPTTAPEDAP